ncbi:MAG TPA: GNAT family N-acetyltransferase [Burkholderiales bacterium]|nr:GNAT family N-acetyltransferase [Burkholderiales bacterium]
MELTIGPLTPDLWAGLEDLFGEHGGWRMYWRIGSSYRKRPRQANKAAFWEVVERGPPPGLLALDGAVAVGWCQLTPREALPWLDRTWRLKRMDDLPVWSLSCLCVRNSRRRRGVTSALIAAALRAAKRGARLRSKPIRSMRTCRRALRAPATPRPSPAPASAPSPAARPPARSCATISWRLPDLRHGQRGGAAAAPSMMLNLTGLLRHPVAGACGPVRRTSEGVVPG